MQVLSNVETISSRARRERVSEQTIRRRIDQGRIPAIKLPNGTRLIIVDAAAAKEAQ
jgi:hypothetical protein